VRKPNASLEQIEDFIRQFKPQYMKRLVLHSQYQLMAKYNIKDSSYYARLGGITRAGANKRIYPTYTAKRFNSKRFDT
jgi:uncharacterized protein YfbU (UPF0304 family)